VDKGIKFSKVVGLNVLGLQNDAPHIHRVMAGMICTKPDGKKKVREEITGTEKSEYKIE
jgi:hypothetical protein